MEPQQHFRFLELPKEIRLMVYDWLPIKTTVYFKTRLALEPDLEGPELELYHEIEEAVNTKLKDSGEKVPHASIVILHKSMEGLTILRTAREIAHEAKDILSPKLEALKNAPLRVIYNNLAFRIPNDDYSLGNLWHDLYCGGAFFAYLGPQGPHPSLSESEWRKDQRLPVNLDVAVRNHFTNRSTTDVSACHLRMRCLLSYLKRQGCRSDTEYAHPFFVKYRMALLSAGEKAARDAVQPFSTTWLPGEIVSCSVGEDIDIDEWQHEWSVGDMA